jgi:hypothetical protein
MNLRLRWKSSIQPPMPRGMNMTSKTIDKPNTRGWMTIGLSMK